MKNKILAFRGLAAIFWLGYFMSISFMEAPLKFTAPGISMQMGVGIGQIIFHALNKCEMLFLFLLMITYTIRPVKGWGWLLPASIMGIMLFETFWLLPALDDSAIRFIAGRPSGPEYLHWLYIVQESIKIPLLLCVAWRSIAGTNRQEQQIKSIKSTSYEELTYKRAL